MFPSQKGSDDIDWQQIAVCIAAKQNVSMITGGPGTGKTTTVTKLLALLQGLAQAKQHSLSIQMVAPTGKAAARLSESIVSAISGLPQELQASIPKTCSTIHRLLGVIPNSTQFRFNTEKLLHADVVVIDEASMVDLPTMSKLFDAIPHHAQVIMLGDKNQLASVEAGSVLSDICVAARGQNDEQQFSQQTVNEIQQLCGIALPVLSEHHNNPIADNLIELQKSHRFSAASGIGRLAKAIQRGNVQHSMSVLLDEQQQDVAWQSTASLDELVRTLLPGYQAYFNAVKQGNINLAGDLLHQQQVLCAQKVGKWGVENINKLVETELGRQGINTSRSDFYIGRPIMLRENDHNI